MKRLSVHHLFSSTLARWIGGAIILAALLSVTPYRTFDRRGTPRVRTAPQIWRLVTPGAPAGAGSEWIERTYRAALVVTIGGAFVLLWCALRTTQLPGLPESAVRRATARAARVLESDEPSRLPAAALRSVAGALALFIAWRLGGFLLSQADTFVSVDHPFHIARADTLRRSLLDGEILRWIAHHQGGYPVEFYPLGFAYFEVLLWTMLLGLVSILVVHKLAVILLLVAPAVIFWHLARLDGRPPIVALLAFTVHIAIPGSTWEGGFTELVSMGLVTNVAGAACSLTAFAAMIAFVARGGASSFAIAATAAAAALWANPRSGVGLLACGCGVWAVAAGARSAEGRWPQARRAATRLAAVASVSALLAAPELISLARYGHLYYFIQYTGYNNSMEFLAAAMNSVSAPVFIFAILGGWAALAIDARPVTRATAIALTIYVAMTAAVSFSPSVAALVPQLEPTRLMPLQRFLTLYLGAVGCHVTARALTGGRRPKAADVLQLGAVAAILIAFGIPIAVVTPASDAMETVERSTNPIMATFADIVKVADRVTPRDRAILIVGSNLSTHEQLWAPIVAQRPYFYDDWMWYWHTLHAGPYNPFRGSVYRTDRMGEVFSREYLARHAIGSVLVAGPAEKTAEASPDLQLVFSGPHSLYSVRNPIPFVTFGNAPATVEISNHAISAKGASSGGDAIIRRNWFPRWHALVNGRAAPVERTAEGYMRVHVPAGPVDLRLQYGLEPLDSVARVAGCAGLLIIVFLLARARARRA